MNCLALIGAGIEKSIENFKPKKLLIIDDSQIDCGKKMMGQQQYPNKVNVVFLNFLKPEILVLMKYYGIIGIPTQALLDKEGTEFFRPHMLY